MLWEGGELVGGAMGAVGAMGGSVGAMGAMGAVGAGTIVWRVGSSPRLCFQCSPGHPPQHFRTSLAEWSYAAQPITSERLLSSTVMPARQEWQHRLA